jgi:O-antigen/teichoic acid export membrane protein
VKAETLRPSGPPAPKRAPEPTDWVTHGRRALETLSFRTLALPLSFVITVITSRYLLPEGRGAFALGLLTVTLGSTLLSIGTAVTRELGRKEESIESIVRRGLVLSVVLGSIGAVALLPLGLATGSEGYRAAELLVLGLPLLLVRQTIGGSLIALGRLRLFNVLLFLDPAALLAGLLVLVVVFDFGLAGAVAAWFAATALTTAIALGWTRDLWLSRARHATQSARTRAILSLGLKAGIVNLVALINYRVEFFLLEAWHDLGAVGVYSVSISLAELLWLLSASVTTVVVAPAINLDEERAVGVVAQTVRHTLILTTAFGIGLAAIAPLAVPLVYGSEFSGAVVPLLILIPGVIAYAPASVLSAYFSMRHGRMRYPMIVAGTSAVVNALLCLVLVHPLGATGAALASTGGYVIGSALLLAMFLRAGGTGPGTVVPRGADVLAYRDLAFSLRSRVVR